MKNIIFILVIFLWCCKKDPSSVNPKNELQKITSDFVFDSGQNHRVNLPVIFNDKSTTTIDPIVSWHWYFDDNSSSNDRNPNHVFLYPGSYKVELIVKDKNNNTQVCVKSILISDDSPSVLKGLRKKLYSKSDTVLVCAHRGIHITPNGNMPENSLIAIREAISNKVDMFECDVRRTSDGVLVLMHDATINRTTNGMGKVSELSYGQLKKFRLKKYDSDELTSDSIPTLNQALDLTKDNIFVVLDIDDKAPVAEVLNVVYQKNMIDEVLFFTSNQTDVQYLLDKDKRSMPIPSCYSRSTLDLYIKIYLKPLIFQANNDYSLWPEFKSANCLIYDNVYLLGTSPSGDNWVSLDADLRNGVNIVQTDYPTEMINYLKKIKRH
jgi:glycerophosphoryl diester phosphodiesterase